MFEWYFYVFATVVTVFGCAPAVQQPPALPTPPQEVSASKWCTADGCSTGTKPWGPVMQMRTGDGAVTTDDVKSVPAPDRVCASPYGSRDESEMGVGDAHITDWEGRPAHIWLNKEAGVETLCRFREGECDKTGPRGDDACVDFTQCCTLASQ